MSNEQYKIWTLVDSNHVANDFSDSPTQLDYKTGLLTRLHPKYEIVSGQLVKVEYYCHYTIEGGFKDLVLSAEFSWDRDENGVLIKREATRRWCLLESTDESPIFGRKIKHDTKFYNASQAAIADSRRRSNIVEELLAQSSAFGVFTENQLMFRDLADSLVLYKETGDRKLVSDIMSYDAAWLNTDVTEILRASGLAVPDGTTLRLAIVSAINYED